MRVALALLGAVGTSIALTLGLLYVGVYEGPVIYANTILCFMIGIAFGVWGAS